MKTEYIKPEIEFIDIESENVLAQSGGAMPGAQDPHDPVSSSNSRRSLWD